MGKYEVISGVAYPSADGKSEKRAAPGEIVDDLPPKAIKDLLEIGAIKEHTTSRSKATDKDGGDD